MKKILIILVIILIISPILFLHYFSVRTKNFDFSWVRRYDKDYLAIKNYKAVEYKIIKKEFKEEYINLLNDNEYVYIEKNEFFNIFEEYNDYYYDRDNDIEIIKFNYDNNSFIIVRAVNANYFDNNYYIFLSEDNELFITHGSMGSRLYWIDKDAIILSLEKIPDEIYIEYSITK